MEKVIADNLGTVVTIVAFIVGFASSYGRLKAGIAAVGKRLDVLADEVSKLKDGGVPVLCRLHEDRLQSMEKEIKDHVLSVSNNIAEMRDLIESNHQILLSIHGIASPKTEE